MSFPVFLPLLVSFGIFFIPLWLLRRRDFTRADDYFVSPGYIPPEAIRNSSIAYSLRLAFFGPFFVFGAAGDFWPVIVGAACLGLGIYLVHILRRPVFVFLASALDGGQSVTVHAFIAQLCGDDRRVRVFAAGLTLFVLVAATACETFALFGFFKLLFGNDTLARALAFAGLLLAVLYAAPAGHLGVIYSGQLQLGAIFLGLFGAAAALLYLQVSALTPLPPYGAAAIGFAALCSLAVLIYRRSRYLETGAIDPASRSAKLLSTFGKVLNPLISITVVLVIVLVAMEFAATRLPAPSPAVTPAQIGLSLPLIALAALVLLPLFHPLADIVQWQRLAAIERNRGVYQGDTARWLKALRRNFRIYAVETSLLWLFIASLGTISVAALALVGGGEVMHALVQEAGSEHNPIAAVAFSLLLLAVIAVGLSTMASSFAAGLCTIRYDLLPANLEASSRSVAGRVFFLAIVIALILAAETLPMDFTSSSFLALVFALCCPVLPFALLILAATFGQGCVGAVWALLVLSSGAVCTTGALIGFIVSGNDVWLWGSVPVCVASGFLILAAARLGHGSLIR